MTTKPSTPKKHTKSHIVSCNNTNVVKLKDSDKKTTFKTSKPKNISRFKTKIQALTEANTAYLFLLK
jgi:hypothetical protein